MKNKLTLAFIVCSLILTSCFYSEEGAEDVSLAGSIQTRSARPADTGHYGETKLEAAKGSCTSFVIGKVSDNTIDLTSAVVIAPEDTISFHIPEINVTGERFNTFLYCDRTPSKIFFNQESKTADVTVRGWTKYKNSSVITKELAQADLEFNISVSCDIDGKPLYLTFTN